MHLYILDWSGTLDRLRDPKGFVRALQMLGHKAVLYSGYMTINHPAAKAVDWQASKGHGFRHLVLSALEEWPEIERVFYSDDEAYFAKEQVENLQTEPDLEINIEYLDPASLMTHLTSLAP
jgi:hypothetical protein